MSIINFFYILFSDFVCERTRKIAISQWRQAASYLQKLLFPFGFLSSDINSVLVACFLSLLSGCVSLIN